MVGEVSASRSVAIRDVTLVVAVSLVYLGFEFLSIPKRWSFLFAGLALGGYVVYLAVDRRHSGHDLGFRRDNLTAGLLPVGVCTAVAPPRAHGAGPVSIPPSAAHRCGVRERSRRECRLLALTFLAGIMWSLLYRRWPNLWLLAGSHSILAALAYPLLLGDAPLSRL